MIAGDVHDDRRTFPDEEIPHGRGQARTRRVHHDQVRPAGRPGVRTGPSARTGRKPGLHGTGKNLPPAAGHVAPGEFRRNGVSLHQDDTAKPVRQKNAEDSHSSVEIQREVSRQAFEGRCDHFFQHGEVALKEAARREQDLLSENVHLDIPVFPDEKPAADAEKHRPVPVRTLIRFAGEKAVYFRHRHGAEIDCDDAVRCRLLVAPAASRGPVHLHPAAVSEGRRPLERDPRGAEVNAADPAESLPEKSLFDVDLILVPDVLKIAAAAYRKKRAFRRLPLRGWLGDPDRPGMGVVLPPLADNDVDPLPRQGVGNENHPAVEPPEPGSARGDFLDCQRMDLFPVHGAIVDDSA